MRSSVLLFVLAWVAACASIPAYAPRTISADGPLPLWRVRHADGSHAGWLLGTFHALPANETLDPRIPAAVRGSDALVLEVSPDLGGDRQAVLKRIVAERGTYPAGQPGLDARMPKERYDRLAAAADAAGVPGFAFARMRPWLASSVVALGVVKQAGFDPTRSVESRLVADRGDVPIAELETPEGQLETLAGIDDDVLLRDMGIHADEDSVGSLQALFEAWRIGDVPTIDRLVYDPLVEDPSLQPMYDRLFFARNVAMAAKVTAMMRQGMHPFVAVGSGHMVGARGIVAALRNAGFRVEQVGGSATATAPRVSAAM